MIMMFLRAAMLGFLLSFIVSCCAINLRKVRVVPNYSGVDPKAQTSVDEWLYMAKTRGLEFNHVVSIGFREINDGDVVGECHYSPYFREIDIDTSFWTNSTDTEKKVLLYHELTHCYCDRGHDYAEGKEYGPQNGLDRRKDLEIMTIKFDVLEGRYPEDYCPLSLMYPRIVDTACVMAHYNDYMSEMFDRCQEY